MLQFEEYSQLESEAKKKKKAAAQNKLYRQTHPKKVTQQQTVYRKGHAAQRSAYGKKWRAEHVDMVQAQRVVYDAIHVAQQAATPKLYRDAHQEQLRAQHKKHYEENYSLVLINHRLWYKKNKKKDDTRHAQYQHLHPEISQVGHSRYHARRLNAEGSFTVEEFRQKCEEYDYKCAYCGIEDADLTIDHVIPLSRGGTDYISNIVPACLSCNSRKKDKNLEDFLDEIKM